MDTFRSRCLLKAVLDRVGWLAEQPRTCARSQAIQQTTKLQVLVSFPSFLLIKRLKGLRKVSLRVRRERMAKAGVHVRVKLCHGCSAQLTQIVRTDSLGMWAV